MADGDAVGSHDVWRRVGVSSRRIDESSSIVNKFGIPVGSLESVCCTPGEVRGLLFPTAVLSMSLVGRDSLSGRGPIGQDSLFGRRISGLQSECCTSGEVRGLPFPTAVLSRSLVGRGSLSGRGTIGLDSLSGSRISGLQSVCCTSGEVRGLPFPTAVLSRSLVGRGGLWSHCLVAEPLGKTHCLVAVSGLQSVCCTPDEVRRLPFLTAFPDFAMCPCFADLLVDDFGFD